MPSTDRLIREPHICPIPHGRDRGLQLALCQFGISASDWS